MPSFNRVIVMGNLTRDPEVRSVGVNAVKVCRFSLALNDRRRDRSGNVIDTPTFVDVDAWDKLGELCGQYLKKGRSAFVEGRLQSDTWEKDGQRHQKLKIRAVTVKFMPLASPDRSRLTGELLHSDGPYDQGRDEQFGDREMDGGYDQDDQF